MSAFGYAILFVLVTMFIAVVWSVLYVLNDDYRIAWGELKAACATNQVAMSRARREVRSLQAAGAPKLSAIQIATQKVKRGLLNA